MSKNLSLVISAVIVMMIVAIGCSGSGQSPASNPLAPEITQESNSYQTATEARHSLLGLYTCYLNENGDGLEVVPLRDAMMHLNALRFLEPPPPVRMVLSNFTFDGQEIDVDVQLVHPFEGFNQFCGFDVCGIVISSGSISGFSDPDIVVAGEGDVRLTNPDGLTRWWNPREFPYNDEIPMFGYIDGGKGTPDDIANYTATLNGYKYHADTLSEYDDVTDINPDTRGSFTPGSAHTRHYTIDIGSQLVFNYAIDACWFPVEDSPIIIPDSYSESANREEPYFMEAAITLNTLIYNPSTGVGGGEFGLDINCYDWFNADQNTIRVECPGVFDPVTTSVPVGGDATYSTYHVDIVDPTITSLDPLDIWISAEAGMDWDGLLVGKPTAAYMPPFEVDVDEFVPQDPELVLIWNPEGEIIYTSSGDNDIEPGLIRGDDDVIHLAFCNWTGAYSFYMRLTSSIDYGHTFGEVTKGYWKAHHTGSWDPVYNMKLCMGSDGSVFESYDAPPGHTLGFAPWYGTYPDPDGGCHSGPVVEHAGEMLYTAEGYPMMFGDNNGVIYMERGNIANIAGTGSWPLFDGVPYTLVDEPVNNWLSISRSALKSSDGICHLLYWSNDLPYISMISSSDTSGESWDGPVTVFDGAAEIWVGASDPGMWIDDEDGYHVVFAGETWDGNYILEYGYSDDPTDWMDGDFKNVLMVPVEDGLNDTQVVVFDAFDETWVFLSYETGGNVYTMYKKIEETEFSEPIQVNEANNSLIPDVYPNGDVGLIFAYQADSSTDPSVTDIYYRLAEWELD